MDFVPVGVEHPAHAARSDWCRAVSQAEVSPRGTDFENPFADVSAKHVEQVVTVGAVPPA